MSDHEDEINTGDKMGGVIRNIGLISFKLDEFLGILSESTTTDDGQADEIAVYEREGRGLQIPSPPINLPIWQPTVGRGRPP